MIRINLKSPVTIGATIGDHGYGRVYAELTGELSKRDDVVLVESPRQADIQVCWCMPYREWAYRHWYRREHDVQVIYTTFEASRIPVGWRDVINSMSALFTTSAFAADVFRDCGIEVPIHNVRHGVNAEKFRYVERNWNERMVYLWCGVHPADRKGCKIVHDAFIKLDFKDSCLVEKWHPLYSRGWKHISVPKRIEQYGLKLTDADYVALLSAAHVFVFPTRGEGFGMLPLEMMATGMAVAVTRWSGVLEYLPPNERPNETTHWPIKHALSDPGKSFFSTSTTIRLDRKEIAVDAVPDFDDVIEAMRFFHDNRELSMKMGERASRLARGWNWSRAADEFVSACMDVLGVRAASDAGRATTRTDIMPASPRLH